MKKKKFLYYAGCVAIILLYWLFFIGPLKGVTDSIFGSDESTPTPTEIVSVTDTPAISEPSSPTDTPMAQPTDAAKPTNTVKPTDTPKPTATPKPTNTPTPTEKPAPTKIAENGTYTSKNEVALYIYTYKKLPSNYITKKEAEALGWKSGNNSSLDKVAPGKSIGGDSFGNYEKLLPTKSGRKYYECDIDYKSGNRNSKRIIYSNDGLIYYTDDHYETFTLLYGNP